MATDPTHSDIGETRSLLTSFLRTKCDPQDLEDLLQQVWLESLSTPKDAPRLPRAYLFGIARHVLYRYYERRERDRWDPLTSTMHDLNPRLATSMRCELGAISFRALIQSLAIDDQVLLEARYDWGFRVRELAAIFDVPDGTIKSRLFCARRAVRRLLQKLEVSHAR